MDHNEIIEQHGQQIARLDTAFTNLAAAVGKLQEGQERIERAIAESGKTNWPILIGTVVAVSGLLFSMAVVMYGAAIHPLNMDISRSEDNAKTLALAVNEQNKQIQAVQMTQARHGDQIEVVTAAIKRFDEQGSTAADKRLVILEWRMDHENKTTK
jgi:tetrahydromethanopterin S-methyltransferase subunit C